MRRLLVESGDFRADLFYRINVFPIDVPKLSERSVDIPLILNKILEDMKSVNVQHNDIKIGEILVDENKKIYLCDFGWSSINNELGCGIGLWNCNNKQKPGGYHHDATTLKRLK